MFTIWPFIFRGVEKHKAAAFGCFPKCVHLILQSYSHFFILSSCVCIIMFISLKIDKRRQKYGNCQTQNWQVELTWIDQGWIDLNSFYTMSGRCTSVLQIIQIRYKTLDPGGVFHSLHHCENGLRRWVWLTLSVQLFFFFFFSFKLITYAAQWGSVWGGDTGKTVKTEWKLIRCRLLKVGENIGAGCGMRLDKNKAHTVCLWELEESFLCISTGHWCRFMSLHLIGIIGPFQWYWDGKLSPKGQMHSSHSPALIGGTIRTPVFQWSKGFLLHGHRRASLFV